MCQSCLAKENERLQETIKKLERERFEMESMYYALKSQPVQNSLASCPLCSRGHRGAHRCPDGTYVRDNW